MATIANSSTVCQMRSFCAFVRIVLGEIKKLNYLLAA